MTRRFSASAFGAVDEAADAERYIAYLDEQAAAPFWRRLKRDSIALLGLRPGVSALDVGCGTGAELAAMGDAATGVDASAVLLAEGRRRAPQANLVQARAEALPFRDGAFGAVRVERTLQHVGDVDAALGEMRRVAQPGARVVAVEPDWETLVVDHPRAAQIRSGWIERIPNPRIGRELARRLKAEHVAARTWLIEDAGLAARQLDLDEAEAPSLAAVTYFLVSARIS